MNLRTPLILFGVLLGLVAVFFGLQFYGFQTPVERKEKEKWLLGSLHESKEKFARVPAADFTHVTIERTIDGKPEKLEFKRKPGPDAKATNWEMVAPKQLRISSRAVDNLIEQFSDAEKDKKTELKADLAQYGLDKPTATVTLQRDLKDKEGKKTGEQTLVVHLGKATPQKTDPLIYATTSEEPKKAVAVPKNRVDRALGPLNEFREKELLGSTINVIGVRVAGAGRKALELEKPDGKEWKFKEPKLGDTDTKAADDLLNGLSGVRVEKNEDFVDDGPLDDAKLAKYGLADDKAAFAVTFRHKGDEPNTSKEDMLLIGARDATAEQKAAIGRDGLLAVELVRAGATTPFDLVAPFAMLKAREKQGEEGGAYFARMKGDNTVVRIEAKHLKLFDRKADELRSKLLARLDATKIDAIDVKSGADSLRLRRPKLTTTAVSPSDPFGRAAAPSEWDMHTDNRAQVKTHLDTVTKLIDAMNKVELPTEKHFLDDDAKQREWFGKDALDLGLDQPKAEITVWQEGIQRDKDGKPEGSGEPKLKEDAKSKPALKLAIGRKDDKRGVVYVRRQLGDDPPAVLAVPDPWLSSPPPPPPPNQFGQPPQPSREKVSLSDLATAGFLHYRDHVPPSFRANEATKIAYTRGGITYELEKDVKADDQDHFGANWKLKQPVEAKGATATDMLLFQLARLNADKLITDRASERDRKEKFGLVDNPLLKATVTVQEKDKKQPAMFTYVIGKQAESEKDRPYYGRIEVKPAEGNAPDANDFVFLVPANVVQFLDTELRDTAVFAPESSGKPEAATFTWNDKAKKSQTRLELVYQPEKEGSDKKVWTIKSLTVDGKDAKASLPKFEAIRLERLLGQAQGLPQINQLVTERFLLHKGKPDPAWQLDPASKDTSPALVLEVKYDNKTTRTLTFGAEFKPKKEEQPGLRQPSYYYATASSLPEAVFLLGGQDFKDLVGGVDFFKSGDKVASAQ